MSQDVNQLKELLFDQEQHELSVLQERLNKITQEERETREDLQNQIKAVIERASARDLRINKLYELTGSPERLRSSVAEILDGALKEADADRTRSVDLRRAMAPFVASTVTAEIRNNKDTLVQVLSPSLGVMIRDYITSAMNDMMAQINRKLEKAIPGSKRKMRAKAKAAGMTMAEMVLAETQKLEVVELYLVRRGSGKVIAHWGRDDFDMGGVPMPGKATIGDNRDALVGGFLSAITEFAKEAFEADKASLRALQIDGFQIYLRHSPAYLMAAKCSGAPLPGIDKAIDAEFLRTMDIHDDLLSQAALSRPVSAGLNGADSTTPIAADNAVPNDRATLDEVLPELASSLEARMSKRHDELFKSEDTSRGNPLKMLLWVIGLPLLALLGWLGWQNYWTSWAEDRTRQTIASIAPMRGYPIKIHAEYGGKAVHISGLTPSRSVKDTVVANLINAMPKVVVNDELTVIPTPKTVDPGPQINAVKRDLKQHANDAGKKFVSIDRQSRKRVTTLEQRNKKRLSALEKRNQSDLQDLIARAERTRKALGDLRALNDKRLNDLQLEITRTAMRRALDRAKKRIVLVSGELAGTARRSGIDKPTSTRLARAAQDTSAALANIAALETSLARPSTKPGQLMRELNQLTRKVSNISKALAAQAGITVGRINEQETPDEPTQAAEELALAAERLLVMTNASSRAIQLNPLRRNVGDVSTSVGKLSQSVGTNASSLTTLNRRVDDLLPGARDRLETWVRRNAIFFTTEAVFRNPRSASAKLDRLADRIKDTKFLVRIIGYTDDSGTPVRNAPLALERARKVRDGLIKRGVPARQLIMVGRTHGPDLSAGKGDNNVNRRVQFEVGFDGERAALR